MQRYLTSAPPMKINKTINNIHANITWIWLGLEQCTSSVTNRSTAQIINNISKFDRFSSLYNISHMMDSNLKNTQNGYFPKKCYREYTRKVQKRWPSLGGNFSLERALNAEDVYLHANFGAQQPKLCTLSLFWSFLYFW